MHIRHELEKASLSRLTYLNSDALFISSFTFDVLCHLYKHIT